MKQEVSHLGSPPHRLPPSVRPSRLRERVIISGNQRLEQVIRRRTLDIFSVSVRQTSRSCAVPVRRFFMTSALACNVASSCAMAAPLSLSSSLKQRARLKSVRLFRRLRPRRKLNDAMCVRGMQASETGEREREGVGTAVWLAY